MKEKGFTLLEILIVSGAAVVAGVLLVAILVNNNSFLYKQTAIVSEGLNINDTLRDITTNISQAAGVAVGYPVGTPTYVTGTETLVLKLPATGASGTINNTYDFIVISKDAGKPKILRLQIFPDPLSTRPEKNSVLTTSLQSVLFKYYDKNNNIVTPASAQVVETSLTILAKTNSVSSQRTASAMTTLRNLAQ